VLLGLAVWDWIHRLGGAGLIVLGLADNSVGSVDALAIVLAASNQAWWWVYAIAATIGASAASPPRLSRKVSVPPITNLS
jgi:hypothetical protein